LKSPVTFYPVATQRQFALNRELIRGKPYEKYFDGNLWLHDSVLPSLQAPMPRDSALAFTPEALATLLEPGYHATETGYCELADGSGYVASLVPFPGCSGEMFRWWFWWHAVEPARYTLWYPHNHVSATPLDAERLTQPGLSDEQRYIGTTHHVDEYIGPDRLRIAISFVDPAELGLDTTRFAQAGIVGHACAHVWLRDIGLHAATMLHLARRVEDGFELRSRYWLGHDPHLRVLGAKLRLDPLASKLGIKRHMAGARVAYEQLLHDQIEFTHLSTFLADIHREFAR
jgi:2,4-diacetylphloroglucinol hydrolase